MFKAKNEQADLYATCKAYNSTLQWGEIFSGHMSHFLVECASKPINNFTTGSPTNGGAVCIPYAGYSKLK